MNKNDAQPAPEEELFLVPIPSLISLLVRHHSDKGAPLTEEEVLAIRDKCTCVAMPAHARDAMNESRGYEDVDPEYVWEDWQDYLRATSGGQ
jgi:hypothetical protein